MIIRHHINRLFVFLQQLLNSLATIVMSTFIKNRSREEIIAALRKSLERKREWEEQAQKEFAEMRQSQVDIAL